MTKRLLQESIEGIRRILYLIPAQPKIAQIEITNRCNFNCIMCQRFPLKVPIKDIDIKIYKKIMSKLDSIEEIILTGWGEPLLHPKLISMIESAKKYNKKVSLTSNGSLLSESIAQKFIDSGLDSISFSIDDINAPKDSKVHPITTQINNIENFMKKIKSNDKKPLVIIQTTLHKGEENKIFGVIKWASNIGADMININRLDMRFQKKLKRPNIKQEKQFIKQLDMMGRKYNIITEFRPHIAFSGITRSIYRLLAPYMGLGGNHCLRIYNYIYINMTGGVTPCCALPLWEVGDILKEDLIDIWKNEKFIKFRKHDFQRKVCGKCDVLEVKQWA